jgi:uncharacterized membrane protein
MRRVNLFLISLLASVITLLTVTIIGFNVPYTTTNQYGNGMGNMGGGMMGQTTTTIATSTATAGYFWTLVAALTAWVIISVAGLAYYLAYPQINMAAVKTANLTPQFGTAATGNSVSAYESIEKTLSEDERKVINTLNLHGGKYLQKYITKEAGLSKLKTHRIVTRLAERGIVTLEKTGNTNTVTLAD